MLTNISAKTFLLLCAVSFGSLANYEANISYLRINQNLFGTIEFPMDAAELSLSFVKSNKYGARISIGRSTETINALYVEGLEYSNKINAIYGAEVFYRYSVNEKLSFDLGVGKTDYKSTWWVNGAKPAWSDGVDSDWSYHLRLNYEIKNNLYLTIGYSDIYRKDKEGYGREETNYFKTGLTYRF